VSRPDVDFVSIRPEHRHWTPDRIAGLVVTIVLGASGWGAIAVGIVGLSAGEVSTLVAVCVGLAVLTVWTIVAVAVYSDHSYDATRNLRRLVGLAWLILLVAGIVAGFVTALAA
jgi:hypothetical protein